jgi:putative transposase
MADPRAHQRRSIRLKGYDFTQPGAYFVTICTADRQPIFGEIVNGAMRLSAAGRIVEQEWRRLVHHFPNIRLDAYVIMPNHLHGIIVINESVGATRQMPIKAMDGNALVEINHLSDTTGSPVQEGATRTMQDMTPEHDAPGQINDPSDRDGSPVREESMVWATLASQQEAIIDRDGSPIRDGSPVREGRPKGPGAGSLGAMIGQFKSRVKRRIWSLAGYDHIPIWHRNHYEHIIRNEMEWGRICDYIHNNPACWAEDMHHPNRPGLP